MQRKGLINGIHLTLHIERLVDCLFGKFQRKGGLGCNLDGHVERTKARPLAAGLVSSGEALQLFVLLLLCSASLLLFLSPATQLLSLVAVALAILYPFMKRVTYLPQFVLGAAYSWGMPMAAMAITGSIPLWIWALYLANLAWTVAFDTFYAMVDMDDDKKIGP